MKSYVTAHLDLQLDHADGHALAVFLSDNSWSTYTDDVVVRLDAFAASIKQFDDLNTNQLLTELNLRKEKTDAGS
jgi:hypothetical protein